MSSIQQYLSEQERQYFSSKSNLYGFYLVGFNWLTILGLFYVVGLYPNFFTILLGIILLGGRQLGLAVLMHDCGHRTLFRTAWLNDWVGQWLCSLPVLNDLSGFYRDHLRHHRLLNTQDDPEYPNYKNYPIPLSSFKRKIIRDLTGQTAIRLLRFITDGSNYQDATSRKQRHQYFLNFAITQIFLIGLLSLIGSPWLYLMWVVAFFTSFMCVIRIRQIAEHGAVIDLYSNDPTKNTRCTLASFWERILFAPNYVNFHLEHHFMASAPCYRLPELHQILKQRDAYQQEGCIAKGYFQVIQQAVHT